MKFNSIITLLLVTMNITSFTSCSNVTNTAQSQGQETAELSQYQKSLVDEGWYFPKIKPTGELPIEYGVKNKYGQQDNYFDIEIGKGCDVAIKIMDESTDRCIRYVLVPENSNVNIQMIPQGRYYLKLAYGKDWMEKDNDDGKIKAKFTQMASYDRSVDIFDIGKKNSSQIVSYILQINIEDSELKHNFGTVEISEEEFLK